MFAAPDWITHLLSALPVVLPPKAITLISLTLSIIGLPLLAALLLRVVYTSVRVHWFLDRALATVLGIVAGDLVRQWLIR